jgi:hypothetical protein
VSLDVWTEVGPHEVFAAYLLAEREVARRQLGLEPEHMRLIDAPDLESPRENHQRLRLLYGYRRHILGEIPPDTRWHRVATLAEDDVPRLRVIGRCGWDAPGDDNDLEAVARRRHEDLAAPPAAWGAIVLWGHGRAGPFTILEGNHRLVAWAGARPRPPLALRPYVGLSPSLNLYHRADEVPCPLVHDFWKTSF